MIGDGQRAIEAALRQRPDDWERWLVYADWLTERGDVRGRIIALEHRLATALARIERDELQEQLRALQRELPRLASPEGAELDWRCGFVIGARVPLDDGAAGFLEALLGRPEGRLLSSLRIRFVAEDEWDEEDLGEDGLPEPRWVAPEALAAIVSLDLERLSALHLGYGALGDAGAEVVAASPSLRGLSTLDLRYCRIGDDGVAAIAGSPHLGGIEALHLQRNEIGATGVRALAASPHLTRLRVLDLRYNPIGADGAAAIARSPRLGGLSTLRLYRDDVEFGGARALAGSEHLPAHLRRYWSSP